jgi:hypothetical protein
MRRPPARQRRTGKLADWKTIRRPNKSQVMYEQGIGGARCRAVCPPDVVDSAFPLEEKGKKSTNIEAVPGAMLPYCVQAPRTHQEPHPPPSVARRLARLA